jgi:exodeoxyribonuclease V alpha subunit
VVRAIDPEASEMVIDLDGRPVMYGFGELDEVALASADSTRARARSIWP